MAKVEILLQGLCQDSDHESAILNLLNMKDVEKYLFSVAFARESGIALLSRELHQLHDRISFYVGISNGVTSIQAIRALLDLGITPFLIDMGTNQRIYHPKIYAAFQPDSVEVILGSANMTYAGLNENVEASTIMTLDRNDQLDLDYISDLENTLFQLHNNYPDHVAEVNNDDELDVLLNEGRLEDETKQKRANVTGSCSGTLPHRTIKPFPVITRRKRKSRILSIKNPIVPASSPAPSPAAPSLNKGLVWRSKELTERDLCIPTGSNTNPTGSMYFKKGLMRDIDQRHYFRDDVFSSLNWLPDSSPSKSHLERSRAKFEIVIDGIHITTQELRLTHNTLTNTKTYRQRNAMTQIHWGSAQNIIRDRNLLGKLINLYHLRGNLYQIAIS